MADQKAMERYNEWLTNLSENDPLRKELLSIKDDDDEINERFGEEMTFGTAGLRGKLGAGTGYMNRVIIERVTKALSNCIIDEFVKNGNKDERERPSCVIAYDPRHYSKDFASLSASILSHHGIIAYTFEDIRPTPELAFLIRNLHADAGINITASHNPKEYNGYKVYWSDGCQISGEISKRIAAEIERLPYPLHEEDHNLLSEEKESSLITYLGEKEDNKARQVVEVGDEIYTAVSRATGIPTANISIVAYSEPYFINKQAGRSLTDWLEIILAIAILLLLAFVVIRTLRSAKEEVQEEEVTVETLLEATPDESLEDIGYQEKSEARKLIEKFVDENPEAVAALLRNWLNEDWG